MNAYNFWPIVIFLFFGTPVSVAQQPVMLNLTVEDGLPSNQVHDIEFDAFGRLWIATEMGVSCYDGYDIRNFNSSDGLTDMPVYEIFKDANNVFWFVSASGRLTTMKNGVFEPYSGNKTIMGLDLTRNIPYLDFYVDQHSTVYIGTQNNGLISIDVQGNVSINHIEDDTTDTLIFHADLLSDSNLILSKGKNHINLDQADHSILSIEFKEGEKVVMNNKRSTISSYEVSSSLKALDKMYLSWNNQLLILNYDGSVLDQIDFEHPILCIREIGNEAWIGTHKSGIEILDAGLKLSGSIESLLSGEIVTDILEDKNGMVWISTINTGLHCIPNKDILKYNIGKTELQNEVVSISRHNNQIYCGNKFGEILIFKNRTMVSSLLPDIEKRAEIRSLIVSDELIYGMTNNTINVFKNVGDFSKVSNKESAELFEKSPVRFMFKNSNQEIIVGGYEVYKIKDGKPTEYLYRSEKKDLIFTSAVEGDRDQLWLGSFTGFYSLSRGNLHFLGEENEVLSGFITSILKINETWLLLGSLENGLFLFNQKDHSTSKLKHSRLNKGMKVNDIVPAGEYECWVASQFGLYYMKFTPENMSFPEVIHFDETDGLPSRLIRNIYLSNDTLYLATDNGFAVVPIRHLTASAIQPVLLVESVIANHEHLDFKNGITLPYDRNVFTVNFTCIDLKNRKDIVYKYRLSGSGTSWQHTTERSVNFSALSPGEYTFEIQAENKFGNSSQPVVIEITINPPFWLRPWFLILAIITILIATRFIIYRREKALKKQSAIQIKLNKEKSDLEILVLRTQMNPHFIFNTLSSIQYLISTGQSEKAEFFLDKFSRLLRGILNQSNNLQTTLLEEVDLLRTYIELQKLRFENEFEFKFEVADNLKLEKITVPILLIQPFLENAIEHGLTGKKGKGFLELSIRSEDDFVVITITDNGIGREKALELRKEEKPGRISIGLRNAEERIRMLNRENVNLASGIEIIDLKDEDGKAMGTKVIIRLAQNE